jgi:cell division protein ZapA (FtsZ GTPase activity inhibitor)
MTVPVDVRLLEQDFSLKCHPDQVASLTEATHMLNKRMIAIKQKNTQYSFLQVLVYAAISVSHERTLEQHLYAKDTMQRLDSVVTQLSEVLHHFNDTLV